MNDSLGTLPEGWTLAPLASLSAQHKGAMTDGPFGSNLKSAHYTDSGPRVIRLQNIGDGVFLEADAHISAEHYSSLHKHAVEPGDVLIAILGEVLPRACLAPPGIAPAIVKADCIRFRPDAKRALAKYVCFALNADQTRRRAAAIVHGVGRPRLNLGELRELHVPVAPIDTQRRIVEAVETQFSRIDAGVFALKRVEANLKRYRASVLKAACEGHLVPTEAELARRESRDYEPASVLLQRILKERRRHWEGAELAKLKAKGKPPTDDRWKAKYSEPEAPGVAGLPTIPAGWCWASVDQLGEASGGVTQNSKRERLALQLPYLRVANVYANELRLDQVEQIGLQPSELERVLLSARDLLVVEGNGSVDQIGRVAVWDGSVSPCVHQNHLIKVRFAVPGIETWTLNWLLSPEGRGMIVRVASSTSGLHTLSLSKVGKFIVPPPPLAEQTRIIAEAESRLTILTAAMNAVGANLIRAERLRQSILKSAFDGSLTSPSATSADAPIRSAAGSKKALSRLEAQQGLDG